MLYSTRVILLLRVDIMHYTITITGPTLTIGDHIGDHLITMVEGPFPDDNEIQVVTIRKKTNKELKDAISTK